MATSRKFCEVAPLCFKSGIESSMLLSWCHVDTPVCHLPELDQVTNQMVLELYNFKEQHGECTYKILHCWLKELYGEKWPEMQEPSHKAVARSIERLKAKLSRLKKHHDANPIASSEKAQKISKFLHQEYILPALGYQNGHVVSFSPLRTRLPVKETKDEDFIQLKQKLYATTRNTKKRLKRREQKISQQKELLEAQKEQLKSYEKKLSHAESQVAKLKSKLDKVNHRAAYWKKKMDNIKDLNATKKAELKNEIETLKDKLTDLDLSHATIQDTLETLTSSDEITTFEGGRYTDNVRACIYELLSLNVGVRNVAPIIKCVVKNIAQKNIGRLPSYTLTCQMIVESLTVLQAQLGEKLSNGGAYTTLQTDATTKFGIHYATYDVCVPASMSDSEAPVTYTFGLRHIFSGSASDSLGTLQEILDDIDSIRHHLGVDAVSGKILSKIKNTMSDRHVAEKLFNEILQEYRAEILPTIAENWNAMTEMEQEHISSMNNFFCGLHFITALANSAEEVLKVWEDKICNQEVTSSSGTQRLIRTACKAFHSKGSEQCGSSILFRSYLRKKGIHTIPLAKFHGNRFNVVFYDAAGVFYLRNHMIKFIETVHGNQPNRLLQSVLFDLKNPFYLSGCQALGLVDKIVTGPLWRKIRESTMSQVSDLYCGLKAKFEEWSLDAYDVVTGTSSLGEEFEMHTADQVWTEMITSCTDSDNMTKELLQLFFSAFSMTTDRLLVDHLPGGKHHSTEVSAIVDEISSVPTTNVSAERDFARLDRLLREKPNANLIAIESILIYSQNKTASWLAGKTVEERHKLIKTAQARVPVIRALDKARKEKIKTRQEEAVMKKQKEVAHKELKKALEKERLTQEIQKLGLWECKMEIDAGIQSIKRKVEKVKALKSQINYRHHVLHQSHSNKSLFKFSENRKPFSVEQLMQNLYQLVLDATDQNNQEAADSQYICKDVILNNPEILVGKRIQHRFDEEAELIWYTGTVVAINEEHEFQVVYDGDDTMYLYPLLEDMMNGDLLVFNSSSIS